MRAVLATAIVALAGYSAARPLTTVGDIADSIGSETDGSPSSFGGSAGSSGSSPLGGSEDADTLPSSINAGLPSDIDLMNEEDSGSGSSGINSGSGIGSGELNMDLDSLDEPSSASGNGLTDVDFSRGSSGFGGDADLDVESHGSMRINDETLDLSEEQLKQLVEYLTRVYGDVEDSVSSLDTGADSFDLTSDSSAHTLDGDNGLLAPVNSGVSAGSSDPFTLGSEGFGDEGFGDEGFGDEGFGDEGFGDEGFGDEGFGDEDFSGSGSGSGSSDSIFPNGRQLTPEDIAELQAQNLSPSSMQREPLSVAQ